MTSLFNFPEKKSFSPTSDQLTVKIPADSEAACAQ